MSDTVKKPSRFDQPKDRLKPGKYEVRITIQSHFNVDGEDDMTEDDVLAWCRRNGEMVDWECNRF